MFLGKSQQTQTASARHQTCITSYASLHTSTHEPPPHSESMHITLILTEVISTKNVLQITSSRFIVGTSLCAAVYLCFWLVFSVKIFITQSSVLFVNAAAPVVSSTSIFSLNPAGFSADVLPKTGTFPFQPNAFVKLSQCFLSVGRIKF